MSLVKHPEMTERNRAAHGRNGRKSRGAATPEGKERSRAANLRHGLYAQERGTALRALGEDPADFAALEAAAREQWRPANAYQARLADLLVSLQWRLERAGRQQDSLAAAHVARFEADRREKTMACRYRYVGMTGFLGCLQSYAARADFYAPAGYIRNFAKEFETEMRGGIREIMVLLHRLGRPQNWEELAGPQPEDSASDTDWAEVRALAEESEDGSPLPLPDVEVEQGEERAGLREAIRYLAKRELEAIKAAWDPFFAKYMQPMTTAERDEAAASPELAAKRERLQREEAACFREFFRLGRFLMKIQDRAGEAEANEPEAKGGNAQSELRGPQAEGHEPKPEVRSPNSAARNTESGIERPPFGLGNQNLDAGNGAAAMTGKGEAAGLGEAKGNVGPNGVRPTAEPLGGHTKGEKVHPAAAALPPGKSADRRNETSKTAGASGDVDENKEEGKAGAGLQGSGASAGLSRKGAGGWSLRGRSGF